MDLRDLRYFAAVVRAGSLTAAAQQINVSQPALSYQLKQLETELGLKLLVRLPRGVVLTEAGEVLLQRATALLDDFAAIGPALLPFRAAEAKPVTIGMSPTPARLIATDLIEVSKASEAVAVSVQEGFSDDLLEMVRLDKLDCALCYVAPGPEHNFRVVPFIDEDLFAVGQTGTFGSDGERTISFEAIARLPLVLDSTHQASRRIVDTLARDLGYTLNTVSATSVTVKRELMSRNGLCTIVPFGLYAADIEAGLLDARRIVDPPIRRRLSLAYAPGKEAALANVIKVIKALIQRHVDEGRMHWTSVGGN